MPFYIQAKCLNNKISKKTNVDKKLKEKKKYLTYKTKKLYKNK